MKHHNPRKVLTAFSALLIAAACATGTAGNTVPEDPPGLIGSVVPPGDTGLAPTGATSRTATAGAASATRDTLPANPPGLIGSVVPPGDTGLAPTATANAAFTVSPIGSDANIVALLHASNQAEIQAGQLAQQKATNESVRAFAQMMVTEHTALDQQGSTFASQNGITAQLPDNNLPQLQATESTALTNAGQGSAFDRAYIAQQVAAHGRTLALVDASIARAQQPALKAMLQSQVRPKVAQHLQQAQTLQAQLGTQ